MAPQKLVMIDRDFRYITSRLQSAILSAAPLSNERVLFGAKVTVEDHQGNHHIFCIVGDD